MTQVVIDDMVEARIEASSVIHADVSRVWDVFSDTERDEEYWGAIKEIKVIKREGNMLQRKATVGPRHHETDQTLVFDPKKSIQLDFVGEGIRGQRRITLVSQGEESSRVDVLWEVEVSGVPGFVRGLVESSISKATEDALKKLKQKAESLASRAEGEAAAVRRKRKSR